MENHVFNVKFKKNSLVDCILLELIKTHHQLKNLNDSIDNDTIESQHLATTGRQKDYVFRKQVRKEFLKEKLNYLSTLLTS